MKGPSSLQTVHGDLPAAQLDRVIELDSGTTPAETGELGDRQDSQATERANELEYLAGLQSPASEGPPPKVRVLMVQVDVGNPEVPRRTLRIPLDQEGQAQVSLAVRLEEEVDQNGVATQLVPTLDPSLPSSSQAQPFQSPRLGVPSEP